MNALWEMLRERTELTVKFSGDSLRAPQVNVCEVLLRHGFGIVEIHRGSNLEGEYLAATAHMVHDAGSPSAGSAV